MVTFDVVTYNKHHNKMTNLDMLLLKGASLGNTEESLAEMRYTILTKGIPANSEGMVSFPTTSTLATTITFIIYHLPSKLWRLIFLV